jgi:hypothetical protein
MGAMSSNHAFAMARLAVPAAQARVRRCQCSTTTIDRRYPEPHRIGRLDPNHTCATHAHTATFIGADPIIVADRGLVDHGQLMMIEYGNPAVVDVIRGLGSPAAYYFGWPNAPVPRSAL